MFVLVLYDNTELTGDSCAIPTRVWASLGGSLPFLGSSLAVETAAGLCSRGPSHSDDSQTWGKGKQEGNEPNLPRASSAWAEMTLRKPKPQSAQLDWLLSPFCLWHLYITHFPAHWTTSPPRWPVYITVIYRWGDRGGFWSCLCSFCVHLRNPLPFISELLWLGKVAAQIRGENLGRLPGLCPAALSLSSSFQTELRPTHILIWQPQRNPKWLSLFRV